jgi:hypothetical protein
MPPQIRVNVLISGGRRRANDIPGVIEPDRPGVIASQRPDVAKYSVVSCKPVERGITCQVGIPNDLAPIVDGIGTGAGAS